MKKIKKRVILTIATLGLAVGISGGIVNTANAEATEPAVDKVVNQAVAKMLEDGKLTTDWEALAVARSTTPASLEIRQARYKEIVDYLNGDGRLSVTDYERTIIGLLAIGADPTNIPEATTHQNLVDELYHLPQTLTGGINGVVYGLLALQAKNYEAPADAAFTTTDLVAKIVTLQNTDGGWAFFGSVSDIDITGMAMTSLAKYRDVAGVEEAIQKSVTYLSTIQLESGGFKSPGSWSNENSNSLSQAIMGLTMNGVDPKSAAFTKQENALNALLAYQTPDGGFKWLPTDTGSNGMALEQATYALAQYQAFVTGKASIYDFLQNPVEPLVSVPEVEVPKPDPEPTPTPEPKPEPTPTPEPKPNPVPEQEVTPVPPTTNVTTADTENKQKTQEEEKPAVVEKGISEEDSAKTTSVASDLATATLANPSTKAGKSFPKTGEEPNFILISTVAGSFFILLSGGIYNQMKKKSE